MKNARNVLGGELQPCSSNPLTGFYRTGCCDTGAEDVGLHVVCAEMTDEFLRFSKSKGNDLSTPMPHFGFPGLQAGDRWCLCAARWLEAQRAGCAPPVILAATNEAVTAIVDRRILMAYALDLPERETTS
jgi:uncharacterized protein (DUF2237 family)